MNTFVDYLHKMGGLHDSRIERLSFDPTVKRLEIAVDDLYSNFEGLPYDPGREPGVITLTGVHYISCDLGTDEGLWVYEIEPIGDSGKEIQILFCPAGSMRVRFEAALFPECRVLSE